VENCGKHWQQAAALAAPARVSVGASQAESGCSWIAALHACSACAGDYEDPDRTAWPSDTEEDDPRDDARDADAEKFPAEER